VPARAVLHIGGRYRFKMFDKPVTLRLLVQNVTDEYGWRALSSGAYIDNAPRRFTA
jgi:outer membrane receptor protein involved in Fe transport